MQKTSICRFLHAAGARRLRRGRRHARLRRAGASLQRHGRRRHQHGLPRPDLDASHPLVRGPQPRPVRCWAGRRLPRCIGGRASTAPMAAGARPRPRRRRALRRRGSRRAFAAEIKGAAVIAPAKGNGKHAAAVDLARRHRAQARRCCGCSTKPTMAQPAAHSGARRALGRPAAARAAGAGLDHRHPGGDRLRRRRLDRPRPRRGEPAGRARLPRRRAEHAAIFLDAAHAGQRGVGPDAHPAHPALARPGTSSRPC